MNPQNPQPTQQMSQPTQQVTPPTPQGQATMGQSMQPTMQNTASPMPISSTHMTPRQMMANHANTMIGRLGFVNTMQKQLLQYKAKKAGTHASMRTPAVSPQNALQQAQTSNPQEDTKKDLKGLETKIMAEISSLREDLKPKDKNQELEDLKKQITEVLNEPD